MATLLYLALSLPAFSAAPLFARFAPDRATIHEGEAFQITLAIHITGETLAPQISIDGLPAPGQLQLYPFQELPNETVTLDGLSYEVRKFRAWARAAKAGTFTLSPRLSGTFIQTTRSFFMMQESRRPATIPVEPMTLSIQSLPEAGRPADFSGLVGRFSFSVVPTPLNIALGDLITATYIIEGDLLPDVYSKPGIQALPELKVYELKPTSGESTPSRQVYRQTLVPCSNTLASIPSCSLSFFDTRQLRYTTLTTGPFPIRYHAERAPVQAVYSPTQTPVKTENTNTPGCAPHAESLSIWARFRQLLNHEKLAIISSKSEVQAYLAPSESSQKLFILKPGTRVTTGATNENWIYVSSPDGLGWVPATALSPSP